MSPWKNHYTRPQGFTAAAAADDDVDDHDEVEMQDPKTGFDRRKSFNNDLNLKYTQTKIFCDYISTLVR